MPYHPPRRLTGTPSHDVFDRVRMRLRRTKGDENAAQLAEGGITAEGVNLASI
jgi:hypothetical protein